MRKIPTSAHLQSALDDDFAWRVRELADIRRAIGSSSGVQQNTFLRAGIALLYAHWEGFIRNASTFYAAYIKSRNLTFSQVKPCFMGIPAKTTLMSIVDANKPFRLSIAIDSLFAMQSESAVIRIDSYLQRIGNLNYDLFENIAQSLNLAPSLITARKPLIDESLLKQRNEIAHGEYIIVDAVAFESLQQEMITIMRAYKNEIENAASTQSYLI